MSELIKIKGIGPTRAARLGEEAEIFTLVDLARANPADVADLLSIGLDAAQALITDAAQFVADEIPFGDGDMVSWLSLEDAVEQETAVEHLLTGKKPIKH